MPLRAPSTDARISKAKKMREEENKKQHRERLRAMLMQKLTVKYGRGRDSGANKAIKGEVDSFMSGKSTITEPDLVALEKGIIRKLESEESASRPATASLAGKLPPSRGGSRPVTAQPGSARPGDDGKLPWLANTSEWKILDAYHAIQNENHMKKSLSDSRKKQESFKAMLDEQVKLKSEKNPSAELQEQDDAYARTQAKLLDEWRDEMTKSKKSIAERHQEEKRVRDMQIAYRKAEIAREKREKAVREERELEDCRSAIEAHKQRVAEKKEQARQRLKEIKAETAKEHEARARRKVEEGLEDQRMMHEYKAKLAREEMDRNNAFAKRMERLEQFTNASGSEGGAGYQQKLLIQKQEEIVLAEARKKEQADLERERRDRRAIRDKQIQMARENKSLVESKRLREKEESELERQFAVRFLRASEDFLRDEKNKFDFMRTKMVEHQKALTQQMKAVKRAAKNVEMDDRERQMNRDLLNKVKEDKTLLDALQKRLTATQKMKRSASTPL